MNDVLIILADGFEDVEAITTIDVLRRLDIDVSIASLSSELEVTSSSNVKFVAECTLEDCKDKDFNAVVLPGGMPGSMNLRNSPTVMDVLQKANSQNAFVCSICAAAIALSNAGVLEGVKFTAYPGFEQYLSSQPLPDMVVQDKNVITGKGPGAVFDFALTIAEALGKETSPVAKGMLLR